MNKIPFIIPEQDLGVRLSRLLVVIIQLGLNKNDKPMLTYEKIAIFDFLVKNPFILSEVLNAEGKKGLELDENEFGTIQSQYPNILSLFDYGTIKGYLQLLVSLNLITVRAYEGLYYYVCSDEGSILVEEINPLFVEDSAT